MPKEMEMLLDQRRALARHRTATSDGAWDGPANERRLKLDQNLAYYRRAYAWRDPAGDASKKASYKFIHHEVSADGTPGAANIRALVTGIAVLNGARGGTTIPTADKRGVWNHLAAHLRDAGRTPPPLRSIIISDFERRSIEAPELRIVEDGGKKHIEGHAAVFDKLSVKMRGFREYVRKGAFTKTIKEGDIRSLLNHDPNYVLGRKSAGTLEIKEDKVGLFYRVTPPDTEWARGLMETIKRGDVTQASFSFRTVKDNWFMEDEETRRELLEVRLFDVGPVTFPAYEATDTTVRSLAAHAGLDADELTEAVRLAINGKELAPEARSLVGQYIEFLQSVLPEEPRSEHSEGKPDPLLKQSRDRMRKKLDLLEREV